MPYVNRPAWRAVWLPLVLLGVAGAVLIASPSLLERYAGIAYHILNELLRDIGIAFIVSAIVAGLFELYRSRQHRIEAMRDVIDALMHEQMSADVWEELQELIAQKQVIRRNMHIRLQLDRHVDLEAHQARLRVELYYELHGLTKKRTEVTIEHELDYHLTNLRLQLPRFERIMIDPPGQPPTVFGAGEINPDVRDGRLRSRVKLPPRDAGYAHIRVDRYEVVTVPGSYNLYLPDFTKAFSIYVAECLPDVTVEVLVRPQGKAVKHVGMEWSCDQLMLPGQGIEVKFIAATQLAFAAS